jgi:hypothetical protein
VAKFFTHGANVLTTEFVKELKIDALMKEGLMFVLAVDVYQMAGKLLDESEGDWATVDPVAATVECDGSRNYQQIAFLVDASLVEDLGEFRSRGSIEDGFDASGFLSGTNDVGGEALATRRSEGTDDNGLACSRFAGENCKAWPQLEVKLVNNGKVFDE